MSASGLEGYHGEILRRLKNANADIGSIIRITTKSGEVFEGTLFPRSEYTDPNHIVLKLTFFAKASRITQSGHNQHGRDDSKSGRLPDRSRTTCTDGG